MLYTHISEFAFKCHVLAPAVGPPEGGFFIIRGALKHLTGGEVCGKNH